MKLHLQGYLLVHLSKVSDMWDEELVAAAMREYGHSGDYWQKTIRVALDELAAAGLLTRLQSELKAIRGTPRLSFRYALTPFGRERMIDTGLLAEVI